MSKSTFRILFYLRKNYLNKSGKAGIMIRLTVNGDMVQFSSKLDIAVIVGHESRESGRKQCQGKTDELHAGGHPHSPEQSLPVRGIA